MATPLAGALVTAGVTIGTEATVSLLHILFAEMRRAGMTAEEVKIALDAELAYFESHKPEDIPDV